MPIMERHLSRAIMNSSVCTPTVSCVFSLTSEKASTMMASRKLRSTMKTSSS